MCLPLSLSCSMNSSLVPGLLLVGKGRVRHLRVERTGELIARAEPLPAGFAHPYDVVRALLAYLAQRVQAILGVVAFDPDLMPELTPDRRELLADRPSNAPCA